MAVSTLYKSTDHWRTAMTCIVCQQTPSRSPLYKCELGHMTCRNCFENLAESGIRYCKQCSSSRFKQNYVSEDFLKKLTSKPGIGRPRRFQHNSTKLSSESKNLDVKKLKDNNVTIEKLFQLSTEQIKILFEAGSKHKLQAKYKSRETLKDDVCSASSDHSLAHSYHTVNEIIKFESKCMLKSIPSDSLQKLIACSSTHLRSKKPIVCPHGYCHKVVTVSSFFQHFKHDHSETLHFKIERGNVLHLIHDVRIIEFGTTHCMAIIKMYEVYNVAFNASSKQLSILADKLNERVPIATFWLMVSGSLEEKKSKSFVLYWLMTNSDEHFTCTLEMSSMDDNICNSTVCSVNGILDSQKIDDVAHRLNCLNLCYPSMRNLLEEGPKLHLRVTVH